MQIAHKQLRPVLNRPTVPESDLAGSSFGRRWKVDGSTVTQPGFSPVTVTVKGTTNTYTDISALCERHELGHVAVLQDVVDEYGSGDDGWTTAAAYDRWQNEVEAWLRTVDTLVGYREMAFVLDALNSYRRGLNVSDADWDAAVELIAGIFPGDGDTVRNYEPLEPDPGDRPPTCGVPGSPAPYQPNDPNPDADGDDDTDTDDTDGDDDDTDTDADDELDGDDGDDDTDTDDTDGDDDGDTDQDGDGDDTDDDGDSDGDGDGDDPDTEDGDVDGDPADDDDDVKTKTYDDDAGWLTQDVLDALTNGDDLEDVAARYNLNPNALPPLLKAMRR